MAKRFLILGLTFLIFLGKVGSYSNKPLEIAGVLSNGNEIFKNPNLDGKIKRTVFTKKLPKKLIYVLKNSLKKDETFLDFANQPMLYFFTQKRVPGYFNQTLQNIPLPAQQRIFIEELANYKTPLLIYSANPISWWDQTDGVPNTLRYHVLTEYIHQNFEPWGEIDGYWIWKRKEHTFPAFDAHVKRIPPPFIQQDLKLYPAFLAKKLFKIHYNNSLTLENEPQEEQSFLLELYNQGNKTGKIYFTTVPGQMTYFFPLYLNYMHFDSVEVLDAHKQKTTFEWK